MVDASPLALVTEVRGEGAEPAPPAVDAQVMVTPETGALALSVTLTTSGFARAVPSTPVWLLPALSAITAGMMVRLAALLTEFAALNALSV